MDKNDSSKIIITDENNLGNSYYIDDSTYYYRYDDDDLNEDEYYDNYSDGGYTGSNSYSNNYSGSNYYGSSYYPRYYSPTYYGSSYLYDDYNDYWDEDYDSEEERRREERRSLTLDGSTLKVGSEYNQNIWLENVSGSFSTVRVIDDSENNNDLFITGNSRSNSIISGDGVTTLWGAGGGQNTLVGGDKRNFFWYKGNSRDVATKFRTGNNSESDVVVLADGITYNNIMRDSASITFNLADGNYIQLQPDGSSSEDDLILFSGNGSDIYRYKIAQYNSGGLNYTENANLFYFRQPGQLLVSGSGHNVWLGGDTGQQYVNVSTLNAGASSGYNTLMGDTGSNVIIGGSGVSTLWGYYGNSADTLIGGTGPEIFRAGRFEGNDVIYTHEGHDVISLYDTNLSDITSANVVGDLISINFNSGNTLSLHNTAEVTSVFQLANGERYNYNRSTQQWQGA